MLSGNRPRGSSSTPVRGKMGSVGGSCSKLGSNGPRLTGDVSGEENRGEAPARRDGQRIGRSHRLEELDELLAPGLLVPLAVALHQLEQLVHRLLALARGEERRGEIEPRLMIPGIALQALAQLGERAL